MTALPGSISKDATSERDSKWGHRAQATLIADDDEFFRMAMRSILTERLHLPTVIETGSFDAALEELERRSDVLIAIFDLAMPGMSSPADLRVVRNIYPATRVIVISSSRRRHDILTALEAGVHGYIPKGLGVQDLTRALGLVLDGLIYVPPSLADSASFSEPVAKKPPTPSVSSTAAAAEPQLTPRQWDVLELLVEGRSNKEIARKLDLGEGTVKIHLSALFRSLNARNRSAAAAAGIELLAQRRGRAPGGS